jgi:hypothetical protein
LAKFSLDGVASPLIIYELPLLLGHQIGITFGPTKSRTTHIADIDNCLRQPLIFEKAAPSGIKTIIDGSNGAAY